MNTTVLKEMLEPHFDNYIAEMPEFYFEKAQDALAAWRAYNIDDATTNNLIHLVKNNYNEFKSLAETDDTIKRVKSLIFKLVAYCDQNAADKVILNEYDDKRTIALSFIRQNAWTINLLKYKNNQEDISETIINAINYIDHPERYFPILKDEYRALISDYFLNIPYDKTNFDEQLFNLFNELGFKFLNPQNKSILFNKMIYGIRDKWDIQQTTKEYKDYNQLFAMDTTTAPNHIDKYAQILRHKKNLILQGAPGTGKTYNTAALALSICEVTDVNLKDHDAVMQRYKQLQDEGRIGFCTFHQSMDYEDFVEGIKPNTENGTVSYDVEDGIFKQIADRARENWEENKENGDIIIEKKHRTIDVLNGLCEKIQREIDENSYADLFLNNKSKMKIFEIFTKHDKIKTIRLKNSTLPNTTSTVGLTAEIILRDYEQYTRGEIKSYKDIKPYHGNTFYYFELYKRMAEYEKTMELPQNDDQKPELQNYVLIIDEINRGNVSRIFGELITLLEADKRLGGEHPSDHPIEVTLPYSKVRFGVPKNLYIVGTMNTTDRSVGNIDYAVRRRFAFATLESQRELVEQHSTEQGVRLYDAVRKFIEKSKAEMDFEDLMVGHSYFFADSDEMLEMRWQYEIKPLLNEYIKDGLLNAETIKTDVTATGFVGEEDAASANDTGSEDE